MKQEQNALSILIPTYNYCCLSLVESLHAQATAQDGLSFEILVADDGSTDAATVTANRAINLLSDCRYIERGENVGRAAIRNFLAQQSRYSLLLFMDSDMVVPDGDFLTRYLAVAHEPVVDGGVCVRGDVRSLHHNLRFRYEKRSEEQHTAARRARTPYAHFHTANFMVHRDVMLAHPFDLRFRHYGYEDVLFGKAMQQHGIRIAHLDNPLSFEVYETNAEFVAKTEEALRTLFTFSHELRGYNSLLSLSDQLHRFHLHAPVRIFHRLFGPLLRRQLCGARPCLSFFNLYKLGYFVNLHFLGFSVQRTCDEWNEK